MSTSHWFKARSKDLDVGECRELLHNHVVGRIAFDDGRGPSVLPVNYVLDGDDVVIATTPEGEIARHATGHPATFEIDDIDPANEAGWSVVVRGVAERTEATRLSPASEEELYPWAEGTRDFLLRIRPLAVTGRRLIPS